jgi:hypothetical protein
MVSVLDFKREVGLWHSILTVRLLSMFVSDKFHVLLHIQLLINCFAQASTPDLLTKNIIYFVECLQRNARDFCSWMCFEN